MTPELRRELGLDERSLNSKTLLALDPGFGSPAFAIFRKGTLLRAARVKLPAALKKFDDGERARRISELIVRSARDVSLAIDAVVFEKPQIYKRTKEASKGNPNNMIKLALVCAGVASLIGAPILDPTPREWSKGRSKTDDEGELFEDPWESERGILLKKRLRPEELTVCESNHDSVDAASIGAEVLGRLDRLFIGST